MTTPNKNELWARYLAEDLSESEEATLIETLSFDDRLREQVLSDAEMDGMLRGIAGSGEDLEQDRFVASVLQRLPAEQSVTPPPVVGTPIVALGEQLSDEDLPIAEPAETSPRLPAVATWSSVAAIAASLLIAFFVFRDNQNGDLLTESDPPPVAAASDDESGLDESVPPKSTVAENEAGNNRPNKTNTGVPKSDALPDNALPENALAEDASAEDAGPSPIVESPETPEPSMSGFALLVNTSDDARWYQRPSELNGQSLHLQSGTASFRLARGAMVSITAPAQFEIDSANSLILAVGSVSAQVPEQAVGFSIDTPSAQVVDLGTEFDLRVTDQGATLVHVTKGSVSVTAVGDIKPRVLSASQRLITDPTGGRWDWTVEINANIFGELAAVINGQSFQAKDLETLAELSKTLVSDPAILGSQYNKASQARYIFNGKVVESDNKVSAADLFTSIKNDLTVLEQVVGKAASDSGAYNVKGRAYVYGNLKEKLQARRNVARNHGRSALGSRFSEHEEFQTVGAADQLLNLQAKLNKRLDYLELPNLSDDSATRAKRPARSKGRVTVIRPEPEEQDDSADSPQDTLRRRMRDRESGLRKLEEIRRRKAGKTNPPSQQPGNPASQPASTGTKQGSVQPVSPNPFAENRQADRSAAQQTKPTRISRNAVRRNPQLDATVNAALMAELQGDADRRSELLGQALALYDAHPAANWQLGNVKVAGKFVPIEEAWQRGQSSPVLASYERMREQLQGTPEGELKLARWCATRRPETAKVHYARLLNNPAVTSPVIRCEAAKNLKLVSYRGKLVTEEELKNEIERQRDWNDAQQRWSKPLTKWVKWLRPQSPPELQQRAKAEMQQANDPGLVLAASQFTTQGGELFGNQLVKVVHGYRQPEASHVLCHMAMNSQWPTVRLAAVTALKDRKLHDYVPDLLGSLIGMAQSDWSIKRQADGDIRYEHVVRQQGATGDREWRKVHDSTPVTVFSNGMVRRTGLHFDALMREGANLDPNERAVGERRPMLFGFRHQQIPASLSRQDRQHAAVRAEMQQTALQKERRVEWENERAKAYNDRIFHLLAATTEQDLPPDPPQWWNWWTDYNEVEVSKQTQREFEFEESQFVDRVVGSDTSRGLEIGAAQRPRHACFVAGTLVATETGMRPIQEIIAGDRVYAKDIKTGELRLQPVLITTVRQADTTLELQMGEEKLMTTPGHPFWVAGEGWQMAKRLKPGDQLHSMRGGVTLDKITTHPAAPVFNLVVDRWHNYFVGPSMLVAHDHSFRTTTGRRLPGLK